MNFLGNRHGGTVALIETCFIISFSVFFLISIPDVSLEITRTPGGWRPIISPFILILNIQVLLKWEIGFGPF